MTFQYDSNSVPVSFTIDDNVFYYFTNKMGDVIGIADSQGKIFARYSYDALGVNCAKHKRHEAPNL